MKIIQVDNFARETVADRLVAVNVNEIEGKIMLDGLRAVCSESGPNWYELVEDDHVLSRGMADLVGD